MFYIKKTFTISSAHKLDLNYESRCTKVHGHNWKITVFCKSKVLNENGMVEDFTHIKRCIHKKFDHQYINDFFEGNPTAENIAKLVCDEVPHCYKVIVEETEGNEAIYEKDE